MKIFFPRNISGSWFGMSVNLWPFTISVFQLIILAMGLGLALSVWNGLYKWETFSQWEALVIAFPIFVLFVLIAFFKVSELTLLSFTAKMIQSHFLDTTKKFQINRSKPDPLHVMITRLNKTEQKEKIVRKTLNIDEEKIEKLSKIIK